MNNLGLLYKLRLYLEQLQKTTSLTTYFSFKSFRRS